MLTNDYNSGYKDLLEITKTSTMEIKRLKTLALEVFKTVNNLNPDFMKDIFYLSSYQTHKKYIFVHSRNTASFGDKSLRALGPHVWNSLPENIKSTDILFLKILLKTGVAQNVNVKTAFYNLHAA